jgi:hypothetical protein
VIRAVFDATTIASAFPPGPAGTLAALVDRRLLLEQMEEDE